MLLYVTIHLSLKFCDNHLNYLCYYFGFKIWITMNPFTEGSADRLRNLLETLEVEDPLDDKSDDEEDILKTREDNSDTEQELSDMEEEKLNEEQYFVGKDKICRNATRRTISAK